MDQTFVTFVMKEGSELSGVRVEVLGGEFSSICHFPADNGANASEQCEPEGVGRLGGTAVVARGVASQAVSARIVRETENEPEEVLLDETKPAKMVPYDCLGTIYHESTVEFDLTGLDLGAGLGGSGGEASGAGL